MSAIAIFTCRPNSHQFQERHVAVQEPVKIGRSVARSRPMPNNAIFDCKVLSRNHALLWYDDGAFYLQDTKSSNGTFVNNQRLSKGSEESAPRQLFSGDIVQFGVDVMENSRRVTHSCIIATVQLFHPDGREATNDHSSPFLTSGGAFGAHSQELFQIAQYLQEALHREQMLENKLATLQRLVQQTQEASDSGWQALIDEDRLLSRLEVLENQLAAYSKNQTEDTLRQELTHLQEDKYNYETRTKESLHKVLQEKFEALRKVSDLERSLSNTEDECSHLREMCEASKQELQVLAEKHAEKLNEFTALQNELQEAEKKHNDTLEAAEQEKAELQRQLDEVTEEARHLQAKVEALQANNDFTKEQLANLKAKMEALRENNGDTPRICEQENKAVQVDMVNLLDLQLLNAKESDESESVSIDDDDDEDEAEYKDKVKDILECLDKTIEEKNNKDISKVKDSPKDNGNLSPEELKDTVCESTSSNYYQEKLKQAQAKIENYRSQLEQTSLKLKESHNKVEKLQGELEHTRMEISSKAARIALLEDKVKESDVQINNMVENAVTDLKTQLNEAKRQAETSTSLVEQLKGKILDLERQLSEVQNVDNSSVIPLSSGDSRDLNEKNISVQGMNTLQEEITKLKDMLSESNEIKSQMEAEISRYKSDLSTSREKLSEADNQVSSLTQLLEEAKKLEKEKLEQNAKLRDQLFELEKSRKDVRQQIISLQGQLREANLREEQSRNEAEKLRLQVRSLQEELDYTQAMRTTSDDGSRELYSHTSQTKYEFLSLKEECASLRKRIQDIEQEMGISHRERLRLETDYNKLQESYHELEQIRDKLEDRELIWQLNLTDSQKESDQCKGDMKHLDASSSQIAELREECMRLREKITELELSQHQMEEEFSFLAYKSQMISACSIIPLIVLFFGIVMAFHPFLSQITATATPGS